ncbi:MAG: 50S ribosomal protein L32 [Candidatus Omnitrophica bacterium]|nr:50S ribosomal protein L32 [Candidatus Omnitrophota bacterium]
MPKVKHRHSRSRGRKRRTHYKAVAPSLGTCSHCGKSVRPHQICPYCGYYKDVQVIKIETKDDRKAKREKKKKKGQ